MIDVLDVPIQIDDAEEETIRGYLKKLLSTLWDEEESFSGKRPFGNSGWKYDVYYALVKARLIKGTIDQFGDLEDVDEKAGDALIRDAIERLT